MNPNTRVGTSSLTLHGTVVIPRRACQQHDALRGSTVRVADGSAQGCELGWGCQPVAMPVAVRHCAGSGNVVCVKETHVASSQKQCNLLYDHACESDAGPQRRGVGRLACPQDVITVFYILYSTTILCSCVGLVLRFSKNLWSPECARRRAAPFARAERAERTGRDPPLYTIARVA